MEISHSRSGRSGRCGLAAAAAAESEVECPALTSCTLRPSTAGAGYCSPSASSILLITAAWLVVVLTRPRRDLTVTDAVAAVRCCSPPTCCRSCAWSTSTASSRSKTDYRDRTLSARNANLEFSRVVRTFVNEYSGLEAPVLALDDLIARGRAPRADRRDGAPLLPEHLPPGPGDRPGRRRRSRADGGAHMALANGWLILVAASAS